LGYFGGPQALVIPFDDLLFTVGCLKSLRSLTINGQIVKTAEEQIKLVQLLQQRVNLLEEFRWVATCSQSFPSPAFPLSNLKTLQWSEEAPGEVANFCDYGLLIVELDMVFTDYLLKFLRYQVSWKHPGVHYNISTSLSRLIIQITSYGR
jgi:hypothetical protein